MYKYMRMSWDSCALLELLDFKVLFIHICYLTHISGYVYVYVNICIYQYSSWWRMSLLRAPWFYGIVIHMSYNIYFSRYVYVCIYQYIYLCVYIMVSQVFSWSALILRSYTMYVYIHTYTYIYAYHGDSWPLIEHLDFEILSMHYIRIYIYVYVYIHL